MSQQINLFNPVFLAQKKIFSTRTMTIGLAVVAAALAAVHATQRVQLVGLEQQLALANAQYLSTQQQFAKFAAEKKVNPSQVLADQVTRLETHLKAQHVLLESFATGSLGNTEGFARYLSALARQTLGGVWLTGFTANGADGPSVIRGRLQQPDLLPTYLRMLNREDALRGRGFAELKLQAAETRPAHGQEAAVAGAIEFTLGAIKPGAAR